MIQIQQFNLKDTTQFKVKFEDYSCTLEVPYTKVTDEILANIVRAFKRKISDYIGNNLQFEITCANAWTEKPARDSKENLENS